MPMGIAQLAAKGHCAGIVVNPSRRWASGMSDGQPRMAASPAAAWEQNGMITCCTAEHEQGVGIVAVTRALVAHRVATAGQGEVANQPVHHDVNG